MQKKLQKDSAPTVAPLLFGFVILLGACAAGAPAGSGPEGGEPDAGRRVALTFDDLPLTAMAHTDLDEVERITARILEALERHGAPAIGFVNEGKLVEDGAIDPARVDLLRRWLEAGRELGNHGYAHLDLHHVSLEDFLEDVARGSRVTRRIVAEAGGESTWFRHPYLHTGRDLETRDAVESFLDGHGYRVAPVTIDHDEYLFAAAWDRLRERGDPEVERVREAYIDYMERVVAYHEQQSRALLGREIPQVLLLHANALNGAALDDILRMLRERGYDFVALEEALRDPAFDLPDRYTGPSGITWIHRWALARGLSGDFFAGEPEVPEWIRTAASRESSPSPDTRVMERVAPGVLSTDEGEEFPSFTPSGDTIYLTRGFATILRSERRAGEWTPLVVAPFSGEYRDRAARVSPDGRRLFFTSNRPHPDELEHDPRDHDLWVMQRRPDGGWGEPRPLPDAIRTDSAEYHASVTADGTLYFSGWQRPEGFGRSDLYRAAPDADGGWHAAVNLGPGVNGPGSEADVYAAPDDSFLLFVSSGRDDGLGGDDIYLVVREGDGWGEPVVLPAPINSESEEYGPTIDPAGEWLYLTSHRSDSGDLWRVRLADLRRLVPEFGMWHRPRAP